MRMKSHWEELRVFQWPRIHQHHRSVVPPFLEQAQRLGRRQRGCEQRPLSPGIILPIKPPVHSHPCHKLRRPFRAESVSFSLSTMRTLRKITVKGFKSIRDQTLELDRLNVLSGGNSPWMPFSFAPQQ
jgi:hypothetical protein